MTPPNSCQRPLLCGFLTTFVLACVSSAAAANETRANQTRAAWKAPRTLDGQPDLQGNWTDRFTRVSPSQILYRFTVEDPTTFVQPFTGELAMNATQDKVYEYACHEGNYALLGILAGARDAERAAAQAK